MSASLPSWARVGQDVICVSNWGGHVKWYLPKRGAVYTIAAVDAAHQSGPMLELVGIGDARNGYKFPVHCFRPLITKSQSEDIAEFRKLLRQVPVRESERAS